MIGAALAPRRSRLRVDRSRTRPAGSFVPFASFVVSRRLFTNKNCWLLRALRVLRGFAKIVHEQELLASFVPLRVLRGLAKRLDRRAVVVLFVTVKERSE
jgi:hypothetical protein